MTEDPIAKLKQKMWDNRISLNIARLPEKTKKGFVTLANSEFCEDYGWCLKWCMEQALEYQVMKNTFFQNIDMKLDHILDNISQNEKTEEKPETREIKMCDGTKRIVREVQKK